MPPPNLSTRQRSCQAKLLQNVIYTREQCNSHRSNGSPRYPHSTRSSKLYTPSLFLPQSDPLNIRRWHSLLSLKLPFMINVALKRSLLQQHVAENCLSAAKTGPRRLSGEGIAFS